MKPKAWKSSRYSPITLGIGSRWIHLVQMKEQGQDYSLAAAEAVPLSKGPDRAEAVFQAVKKALATGKFKGRRAALCLKGDDLFVQHQRVSREGGKQVEDRLREELSRNVPFDMNRAHLQAIGTGKIFNQNQFSDELIIMIADRAVTDQHLAVLETVKLEAGFIGVEPMGLVRALLQFPGESFSAEEVTGFMNIGASKTELIVLRE
ncbi:MAG: pilus assembly protein PilM, partial [Planctomycetes bacterium]|nr:pilus assembly protein PilM [Planctomycetota bacterium]